MMPQLLDLNDALRLILKDFKRLSTESIATPDALHRVLAHNIYADTNLPPFDNSAMDGFAVHAQDTLTANPDHPIELQISMDIPAGHDPAGFLNPGEAARIMTGAVIPRGADAVIPVEDTDADFSAPPGTPPSRSVKIFRPVRSGDSLRKAGENIRQGQLVLQEGQLIRPQEIGILAGLGIGEVSVIRNPRVVILGSGDELIDINQPLTPGKIRDTNSYTLEALVRDSHAEAIRLPIAPDNPDALRELFHSALAYKPDLIISSAGVSVGAADFIRQILGELGSIDFWRLNLRPGKPLAYGKVGNVPFFGLPGNPVSVMVTFEVVVRPALLRLSGRQPAARTVTAVAGERIRSDGRRTYVRVRLENQGDVLTAYETGTQSSGALMSMVIADALLIIPENVHVIETGSSVTVQLLRLL